MSTEMKNMTLSAFASITAEATPSPGGGSVSAAAGAMGAALSSMAAGFSLGRDEFKTVEGKMAEIQAASADEMSALLTGIQTDADSFDDYMTAMKLPKDTPEAKAARSQAMQNALKHAAEVPMENARRCAKVCEMALFSIKHGNKNVVTDALVSLLVARAGMRGALLNVKINLGSIRDEDFCTAMKSECIELEKKAEACENEALSLVPELA